MAFLTRFVNLMLRREVPEFAQAVMYGARMFALSKKNGIIHPIVVGNILRCLATEVGAKSISPSIEEALRSLHFGVSSKGGCGAAAYAACRYQGEALHRRVIFKVDIANAFNSLHWDVFWLQLEREHRSCTGCCTKLTRGLPILSMVKRTWCRQQIFSRRPPLGTALFSLGIDNITRGLETVFNVWYLDNGTLEDLPEKILAVVTKLVEDLRTVGLELSSKKCELIILNHTTEKKIQTFGCFKELLPELKLVPAAKSFLLGTPLSEEGIAVAIREKREDLEQLVSKLKIIENHQVFILLKDCFALLKLQYILRISCI